MNKWGLESRKGWREEQFRHRKQVQGTRGADLSGNREKTRETRAGQRSGEREETSLER